ncbi:MAG: HAMP domain-containing histidine kinase [Bacteroidales bacterium]|nr:HAMP domain-containing histidine kinase [Bacteroidales bacterium]MBK7627943.1 HAMP domain-containing histidine kinase [Bacteroidales bacterium]
MQIRTRLTLQFLLIGGIIMIIASAAIYFSTATFRNNDFYNALRIKAQNAAKLMFNAYDIDGHRVLNLEKDYGPGLQNVRIMILDFKDEIVYSSDENNEIKINYNIIEQVRLGKQAEYKQPPFEVSVTLYYNNYDRYVVIAAAVDTDGSLHLKKLKTILIVVWLISLIMFFIVGWFFSGRALKPINDVIKKVENISITSLNLRVPVIHEKDEIGRLAKTFNNMLERLEASFGTQKIFISNASHELRTPLTSINGQLEVLMMKDRSSEEYKESLASILDDIRSLIDLSNRLLLIARTSTQSPVKQEKKIRIDEILWQVQEDTKKHNNNFNISISLDQSLTDSDQMLVDGDESLLKVAVSNLIDNACKYSADNSVEIILRQSGKMIEIVFKDRGIGIPEEDLKKVFDPFYRSSNALTYRGSGIGLQLVNQIIKIHNGEIRLTSEVGVGTEVVVLLPVAG